MKQKQKKIRHMTSEEFDEEFRGYLADPGLQEELHRRVIRFVRACWYSCLNIKANLDTVVDSIRRVFKR